jgi:hypothetical protein
MADKTIILTKQNVENAILRLESIDSNDEFAYEKAILSYLTIKHLPIFIVDIPEKAKFFRSRTHRENPFFTKISDISLAPNIEVTNYARCNKPFQSKFYCSENRPASYMELIESWIEDKKLGEKVLVTISEWELKTTLPMIIVTTPEKEKRKSEFDKTHGEIFDTFIDRYEGETKEANVLFYKYLFEKFRSPAKRDLKTYIITSAYCNLSLFRAAESNINVTGIFYPSVPFNGQGTNFCINQQFVVKENIELMSVSRNEFLIEENEDGKYNFQETEFRESKKIDLSGGIIEW